MKLLDLTLEDPNENVALDEALLEQAESSAGDGDVLRLWEPRDLMVVLGRSSPIKPEVNLEYCLENEIPVTRRSSGGATIVTGPGCLMYCVSLGYENREHLRMLDQAHHFVMSKIRAAVQSLGVPCEISGTSDLTLGGQKVSGNSMRCKRNYFIYHGTLLYEMSIEKISKCLGTPVRQPDYRDSRSHQEFLTLIPRSGDQLREALIGEWSAHENLPQWPKATTRRLVELKYDTQAWVHSR